MNVENILRVADAIEKHAIKRLGFNMERFVSEGLVDKSGHKCGTTACIGGYAVAVFDGYKRLKSSEMSDTDYGPQNVFDRAIDLFDITEAAGDMLMVKYPGEVTPAQAVRTLRHLAATGEVRWELDEAIA